MSCAAEICEPDPGPGVLWPDSGIVGKRYLELPTVHPLANQWFCCYAGFMSTSIPSVAQLKRAIVISGQIEKLEAELAGILGSSGSASTTTGKRKYTKKGEAAKTDDDAVLHPLFGKVKRKYTRRAVVAETGTDEAAHTKKKRGKVKMSEEGRAAIVAAQKARWAKIKKEKKAKAKEEAGAKTE